MSNWRTWIWGLACWSLVALTAQAQGVLIIVNPEAPPLPRPIWPHPHPLPRPVPAPPMSYKIKELAMQAKIVDQVAQVEVSQSFVNTGSQQMEVQFVFPLPYDGAVDRMTLLVDGKEFPAKLQDAKQARSTYEEIVRRNRDPALLEWVGTGMFQTSVFPVPAGAERKVSLRYSQLCRTDKGLTELMFPLSTAKYTSHPVETVSLNVAIESAHDIKNVYSPTHAIDIQRPDNKHALIKFTSKDQVPSSDFRVFYDVGDGALGTRVISYRPSEGEDGYFLLLGSPKIETGDKAPPAKTVVFVVDKSGSMSGEKIEQAKSALKFVLNNLRPEDTFNVIAYDSEVVSFRPELEKFNDETRNAAIGFVNGLYAGGGTNIDGALGTALNQLKDGSRPTYVLFLTDGLPTVGEQNEMKITENAKTKNAVRARIISFGVGYDLNSRLLDRLSRANYGQSEYVRPNENIEVAVSKLYAKISTPVLSKVGIKYEYDAKLDPASGDPINRVYPKEVHDVFAGGQIVVVGRYRLPGTIKVTASGEVAGARQELAFPADLVTRSGDETYAFVEKIWAMRRIGEIIDEMDLKGRNEELVKELIGLSTKHGILTQYTSFLADENNNFRDTAANIDRTRFYAESLSEADGVGGFNQRASKKSLQEAERAVAADSAPLAAPAASAPGQPSFGGVAGGSVGGMSRGAGVAGPRAGNGPGRPADARKGEAQDALSFEAGREADEKPQASAVQNVGNKTFYRRAKDQRWIDSVVTEEREKNAVKVTQFSDEYFALAAKHGRKLSQYYVIEDPLLLDLDGVVYQIDPPAKN